MIMLAVSLECSAQAMTVILVTEEAFTGRVYTEQGGRECEVRGNGRTDTRLVVGLEPQSLARCGVRREDGVLTTVVTVQHHPVVQRRGDKAVRVICYFDDINKVVTDSYDIIAKYGCQVVLRTLLTLCLPALPSPRLRLSSTAPR